MMRITVVLVTVKLFLQFLHASFQILDFLFIVRMLVWVVMVVSVCHPTPLSWLRNSIRGSGS